MSRSSVLESLPRDVTEFAAHAVDPLEIAADLEASGISNRVARDVYGAADVFELANGLWQEIPFVAAEVEPETTRRPGNVSDLGRGLVYGAPGLLLFALQHSWDWALPTWVLALAVTWGWGVGQMAANLTYTLRTRHDASGERFLLGVVLVATPMSTILVVGGVGQVFDITMAATLVATVLTAYMVAAAILVLHEQLLVAALCLLPGVVVAIDALAGERWSVGSGGRHDRAVGARHRGRRQPVHHPPAPPSRDARPRRVRTLARTSPARSRVRCCTCPGGDRRRCRHTPRRRAARRLGATGAVAGRDGVAAAHVPLRGVAPAVGDDGEWIRGTHMAPVRALPGAVRRCCVRAVHRGSDGLGCRAPSERDDGARRGGPARLRVPPRCHHHVVGSCRPRPLGVGHRARRRVRRSPGWDGS